MHEKPQSRSVRRAELEVFEDTIDSDSSEEEVTDATTIQSIQASIGIAYHYDYHLIQNEHGKVTNFANLQIDEPVQGAEPVPVANDEDEGFEFRLFATQKPSDGIQNSATRRSTYQKINIRSPTPVEASDGRFLHPHRPTSYYFAPNPSASTFAETAVTGADVLQSCHSYWPGTLLPWRVVPVSHERLSASTSVLRPRKTDTSEALQADTRLKRKPNKKRRILLRTREAARVEKIKEKEVYLREKRTRLNRERKVKRRVKEKAAKAAKGKVEADASRQKEER